MATTHSSSDDDGSAWPPGTITLEGRRHSSFQKVTALLSASIALRKATEDLDKGVEIVLHPTPTNDPNDPLVGLISHT
jgi:hypothetical protein